MESEARSNFIVPFALHVNVFTLSVPTAPSPGERMPLVKVTLPRLPLPARVAVEAFTVVVPAEDRFELTIKFPPLRVIVPE